MKETQLQQLQKPILLLHFVYILRKLQYLLLLFQVLLDLLLAIGINRAVSRLGWTDCPGKSLVPLAGLRLGVTPKWLRCANPQSHDKDLLESEMNE